jgi:competence protein ComEC
VKGLLFIVRNFDIGEFWESGISDGDDAYRELKATLAATRVPVRRIDGTTKPICIGRARIEPLAPLPLVQPSSPVNGEDLNESSLVFRLRLDTFTLLFTGDIGPETEGLLADGPSAIRCTVLKVAHHGSRNSSSDTFLAASSPVCGVISAGYGNIFGLPAPETVERLGKRGAVVYRTDRDGTITVTWEGGRWSVATCRNTGHFH